MRVWKWVEMNWKRKSLKRISKTWFHLFTDFWGYIPKAMMVHLDKNKIRISRSSFKQLSKFLHQCPFFFEKREWQISMAKTSQRRNGWQKTRQLQQLHQHLILNLLPRTRKCARAHRVALWAFYYAHEEFWKVSSRWPKSFLRNCWRHLNSTPDKLNYGFFLYFHFPRSNSRFPHNVNWGDKIMCRISTSGNFKRTQTTNGCAQLTIHKNKLSISL